MACTTNFVQWAQGWINWLVGSENNHESRITALEGKIEMVDQNVTSLQEAFSKYVANVNTKLSALSAQIAAVPNIDAANMTAIQQVILQIQAADAALGLPTPATPAAN